MVVLLLFSSCSLGAGNFFKKISMTDQDIANKTFEQVLKSIQSKDKEALQSLFSKKALKEAKDFDGSMDYLFDFFHGEVESWDDNDSGPIVDELVEGWQKITEYKSFYNVFTDKQKYYVFILEYPVDTARPDNVGVYSLRIIKSEDEESQWGYWQDMKMAGIYKPQNV
jgi:hypothetical protein